MSGKRYMLSFLLIAVALGSLVAGSFALFSDSETSGSNSFTAGWLDLKVADNDEGFSDGVTQTWVMKNMIPGSSIITNNMQLQNFSSINADHVELGFSFVIDEASNPVESDTNPASTWADMAKMLEVKLMAYDGSLLWLNGFGLLSDLNGNGWLDLEDLTKPLNAAALDNLRAPNPPPAGAESLMMTVSFRPEAGNDLQGDILIMTVTATLNQDASQ